MAAKELGTVSAIARYPVKSMRGEAMEAATVGFQGIPLDRSFAFVQEGDYSSFPWFTARQCPELLRCQPFVAPDSGRWPTMMVRTPDGDDLPLDGTEFGNMLERWSGRKARLHSDYRGTFDVAYVSVISTATVRALSEAAGVPADHRRFRMTFVVDLGGEPFAEKAWVGREIAIGDVRIAVHEQDRRCQMITLDPETGVSEPAVLKKCGEMNDAYAGVYASVLMRGEARVGDMVSLVG